jgi:hypothetical protein
MHDVNKCTYHIQLDELVLDAFVEVGDGHQNEVLCKLNFHIDGEDGLVCDVTRGQLMVLLQFLQAIWTQIDSGTGHQPTRGDWRGKT